MRMRRKNSNVELPEKVSPGHYINIRSAKRKDVRPGETVTIQTDVLIALAIGELAHIRGENVYPTSITSKGYKDLLVIMNNRGDRNIMINPGQVIASMEIVKVKKAAKKRKTTTITTEARWIVPEGE